MSAALSSTSAQLQGATYPTVIAPQQSEAACRTALMMPAGAHLRREVQELLAIAAHWPLPVRDLAQGRARGDLMEIPLTNDPEQVALIDAEDYSLVRSFRWSMNAYGYARASCQGRLILMHRVICMVGKSRVVDHKNHDTLDNRKSNLRVCVPQQNSWNSRLPLTNKSGIKGVVKTKNGKWEGRIASGAVLHSKTFPEKTEAQAWVQAMRNELHGEFSCHG